MPSAPTIPSKPSRVYDDEYNVAMASSSDSVAVATPEAAVAPATATPAAPAPQTPMKPSRVYDDDYQIAITDQTTEETKVPERNSL